MATLNTIKSWFKRGKKPTEAQFMDVWDSYFHKDANIPASKIQELPTLLNEKVDQEVYLVSQDLIDTKFLEVQGELAGKTSMNDVRANIVITTDQLLPDAKTYVNVALAGKDYQVFQVVTDSTVKLFGTSDYTVTPTGGFVLSVALTVDQKIIVQGIGVIHDLSEITYAVKKTTPGNVDFLRGPYATIAAANLEIPNTMIDVDGIPTSFRKGKFVDIGSDGVYKTYWWSGTTYGNETLVEYFEPVVKKTDVQTKVLSNQKFYKKRIQKGVTINSAGAIDLSFPDSITTEPIFLPENVTNVVFSGLKTGYTHRLRFLDGNKNYITGTIYNISGTSGLRAKPTEAKYVQIYFRVYTEPDNTTIDTLNINFSSSVLNQDEYKEVFTSIGGATVDDTDLNNISFTTPNLIDNSKMLSGGYSLSNVIQVSNNIIRTPRILVQERWRGKVMTLSGYGAIPSTYARIIATDIAGTILLVVAGLNTTDPLTPIEFTMPDNAYEISFSTLSFSTGVGLDPTNSSIAKTLMLNIGDEAPWEPYGRLVDGKRVSGLVADGLVGPFPSPANELAGSLANDQLLSSQLGSFTIVSPNLADNSKMLAGGYTLANNVTTSTNIIRLTPIEVQPDWIGLKMTMSGYGHIPNTYAWVLITSITDEILLVIPGDNGTGPLLPITFNIPVGAHQIKLTTLSFSTGVGLDPTNSSIAKTLMLNIGDEALSWYPYGALLVDGTKVKGLGSSGSYSPVNYQESLLGNTKLIDLKGYDILHIAQYGQSLSIGAETTEALTTIPVTGNYRLGSNVWDFESSVLNPLINIGREDSIVVSTNVFSELFRNEIKREVEFLATSSGVGSTTVDQLSDETKTAWPRFTEHIDNAKVAAGVKTIACPAIIYIQGESDYTASNDTSVITNAATYLDRIALYKSRLIALKNKMQAHIMTTYGQEIAPLFFVHQPGGQWAQYKENFVQMAQIEACRENEDMILIGSPYYVPAFDRGHLTQNGYRMHGEMIGKYLYRTLCKNINNEPISPKNFKIVGNDIFIECVVQVQPLQINTWQVAQVRNYGFDVYLDEVQASISVSILGGNVIKLSVSADLEAASNIQVNYGTPDTGADQGCGNICDSDKWTSRYDYVDDSTEVSDLGTAASRRPQRKTGGNIFGEKYPVNNWLIVFSEVIKS